MATVATARGLPLLEASRPRHPVAAEPCETFRGRREPPRKALIRREIDEAEPPASTTSAVTCCSVSTPRQRAPPTDACLLRRLMPNVIATASFVSLTTASSSTSRCRLVSRDNRSLLARQRTSSPDARHDARSAVVMTLRGSSGAADLSKTFAARSAWRGRSSRHPALGKRRWSRARSRPQAVTGEG